MQGSNQTVKTGLSWTAVILLLIFFWPVGIYLLIKKVNEGTTSKVSGVTIMTIFKWICLVLAIIFFINLFLPPSEDSDLTQTESILFSLGYMIFFGAGAFLLQYNTKRVKEQEHKNRLYDSLVRFEQVTSVDTLAAEVGDTPEQAMKTVDRMIKKGYWKNIELNLHKRELVYTEKATVKKTDTMMITCPNCGAHNRVLRGVASNCEYCDSPLTR